MILINIKEYISPLCTEMTQNIPIQVLYTHIFKPELYTAVDNHIALFEGSTQIKVVLNVKQQPVSMQWLPFRVAETGHIVHSILELPRCHKGVSLFALSTE